MRMPTAKLGYTAAALTLLAAALVPLVLTDAFTKGFCGLPLHVDEMYRGGPKLRTVATANYFIDVHRVVSPHMLQREKPFVQLDWRPVDALPAHISDIVDIDGDGQPDVRVSFDVPHEPKTPLRAEVESLNPQYETLHNLGKQKFSELIVRVDDAILVRIPTTTTR